MKLILDSYAKLNLYLLVINKRKDNYHTLRTVFERISLADKITLKSRTDNKIILHCDYPGLPKDYTLNLAFRSAKLLQDRFNVSKGVDIFIKKNIPIGSGMGGGSSNAATVLIGLNRLWRLGLSVDKLAVIASQVGSDVPFFVYQSRFAQAGGRGEIIEVIKSLRRLKLWHVLVIPNLKVSTPFIYKKWDKTKSFGLTRPKDDVRILKLGLAKKDTSLLSGRMYNSLDEVACLEYPEIQEIKKKLLTLGAKAILMSGSGPTVFGTFSSKKEALALYRKLKAKKRSWDKFLTHTI
jgi:4-diphosphocytidyl-2-C-methyl-D-erythritol kinase